MKEIQVYDIQDNAFKLIAKDWMLVSVGKAGVNEQGKLNYNTMTANWGGVGNLWHKPVVYVFVRPERYTHSFMEQTEQFTLSFFDDQQRNALNLLGKKSGRDGDKIAESGLHPTFTPEGNPTFEEARMTLECKKLFKTQLNSADFLDPVILANCYGQKGGFHHLYIAEIQHVWVK
jgi:flavin reductase (DIM6/NTAB) family NADH-FMN oxidoreductase RutF